MKPNFRESILETRRKKEAVENKRLQVAAVEALLQTHESMPVEDRDHDYELHFAPKSARNVTNSKLWDYETQSR